MSRRKIICPFCEERFWSLARFYAHLRVCEAKKKWKNKRPCWETNLQGSKKDVRINYQHPELIINKKERR